MKRTALLDQPALWDEPATDTQPTQPKKTHAHPRPPRRNPDFRALPCQPECIICGHPEHPDGLQYCQPSCTVLCQHVAQPHRADICLTTVHVTATVHTSPHSGHAIAAVACPHCGRLHPHTPNPGTRYRISGCGKPYIVHTPERSNP